MVKTNKLLTLALAAVVLAVVASGTASADSFSGTFQTSFYGNTPTVTYPLSSGTVSITPTLNLENPQETMIWDNSMYNGVSNSVWVYNDAYATNTYGSYADVLYNQENSFQLSGLTPTSNSFQTLVAPGTDNPYTIRATHSYQDGNNCYTSPVNSNMHFNIN